MKKWVLSLGFILLSISFFLSSCGGKNVAGIVMSEYESELIIRAENSRMGRIIDMWDYKKLSDKAEYDFQCTAKEEIALGRGTCVFTIYFSIDKYGRIYKFTTTNGKRTYDKEFEKTLNKMRE